MSKTLLDIQGITERSSLQHPEAQESSLFTTQQNRMQLKALILAGGLGTRLRSTVGDVPKSMALIVGKPFLEHQLRLLKEQGIKDIILAVHYMADKIKSYFGDGRRFGVDITYSEEEVPLGTGGAIKRAEKYIDDTFLVLNGDSYSHIDLKRFLEFHKAKMSNFSISLVNVPNVFEYGKVLLEGNKIKAFLEKGESGEGLINSGAYIFEPRIFTFIESEKNVSLEKDIFPKLIMENLLFGYHYEGYFMDIGRPETYEQFKQDILSTLLIQEYCKVREAMQRISKTGIDVLMVVDTQKKLLGIVNNRILKEFILEGGNMEEPISKTMVRDPTFARVTDESSKISEILLSGIHRLPILDEQGKVKDIAFHIEKVKTENFPVIRGKSPLRIAFSGGGTDVPHFFEKYGGVVISATINKYCYATLVKRADTKITIDSDIGEEIIANSRNDLIYDGRFDLIKAVINMLKPDFGFELYLHNDVPPGRGLGSSASLAVLLISMISYLQDLMYDDYKIAEIAYKVEREQLKIGGGWQDQYAAVTGGFNFMEFNAEKTIIYPLRLKEETVNEFNERMLLCYVGNIHSSGDMHQHQAQTFMKSEDEIFSNLNETKSVAIEIKDALLTNHLENIGLLLNKSWENKKKLSPTISTPMIDYLYTIGMKNGAYGGRLLGAGGGGYLLFFFSPRQRNRLTRALEKAGGEIMNFHFEFKGMQHWLVKNKF